MEHTDAVYSHKLSGAPARLASVETFSLFSGGVACFGQDRKHHYGGLYKQTRGATLTSSAYIGTWAACMEELSTFVAESHARADCAEPEGRFAVQRGSSLQGLETPHTGQIWSGRDRSLCIRGDCPVSPVLQYSLTYQTVGTECFGAQMAACSPVLFYPLEQITPTLSRQGARAESLTDPDSSILVRETLASGDISAVATANTQGCPVAGTQGDLTSSSGAHGPVGLACERLNLTRTGLPQNLIATIQSARAPSTRCTYDGKWRAFEDWCVKVGCGFPKPCSSNTNIPAGAAGKGFGFLHFQSVLA